MAAFCGQECTCLLDISTVQGCTDADDILYRAAKVVKPHSSYVFKVVGENRIVAVAKKPDSAVGDLNSTVGQSVEVNSCPMYKYENFAKNVLKLEEGLCSPVPQIKVTAEDFAFWVNLKIEYKGKSMDQILDIVREEATFALGDIKKGFKLALYKCVFKIEMHAFVVMPGAEETDVLSFLLPLMKLNGDQVQVMCKNIKVFVPE